MGIARQGRTPVIAVAESDHDVACIFHTVHLAGIPFSAIRMIVMGAIDVDSSMYAWMVIDEIGACPTGVEQNLCIIG
jgi:hypothetical protein